MSDMSVTIVDCLPIKSMLVFTVPFDNVIIPAANRPQDTHACLTLRGNVQ